MHLFFEHIGAHMLANNVPFKVQRYSRRNGTCFLCTTTANNTGRGMVGYRCSLIFLAWLLITIVLHSQKPNRGFDKTSCNIAVSSGLDIKPYPTRNSGPTRRFLREALVPPSLKCMAALKFTNITLCATYKVPLARDI